MQNAKWRISRVRKFVIVGLAAVAVVLIEIALYGVFISLPILPAAQTGFSQKIFYFHVPAFWASFLAFFITFLAGILYLAKKEKKYDILGYSSAELGLVFGSVGMFFGIMWNRPAWGVWWTWDPRLVTALILLLLFAAYFVLRSMVADEDRRARYAAVFGIIAFLDVPVTWYSTRLIQNVLHPVVFTIKGMMIEPMMLLFLLLAVFGMTALYASLLLIKISTENIREQIEQIKGELG